MEGKEGREGRRTAEEWWEGGGRETVGGKGQTVTGKEVGKEKKNLYGTTRM